MAVQFIAAQLRCHPDASTVSNAGKDQVFPATDVMYVGSYTFARPKQQQHSGWSVQIVRYDNWSTTKLALALGAI